MEGIIKALEKLRDWKEASNILCLVGEKTRIRVSGMLILLDDVPDASGAGVISFLAEAIGEAPAEEFRACRTKQIDFSYMLGESRFRVNVYKRRGLYGLVAKKIVSEIPSFGELGFDTSMEEEVDVDHGLVLFAGAANTGKTTSMASCVDLYNSTRTYHIITIEDPIEYLHVNKKSVISQREIGPDVATFEDGIQSALRQNPDVMAIGEMRSVEVVKTALRAAETGHIVLGTIHSASLSEVVTRVTGMFDEASAPEIRAELASALRLIVWQKLISLDIEDFPGLNRMAMLYERIETTSAVRNLIRSGREGQLSNEIRTQLGGKDFEEQLHKLAEKRLVSYKTLKKHLSDRLR